MICSSLNLLRFILVRLLCVGLYQKPVTFQGSTSTTFYATVNDFSFLVDHTGNSRWWTIPVVEIDYEHNIDMQQLFAQLAVDFRNGEPWWLDHEEEEELAYRNSKHNSFSLVRDKLSGTVNFEAKPTEVDRYFTASELLEMAGLDRPTNAQAKECGSLLRSSFGDPKRVQGRDRWRVPLLEDVDEDDQMPEQRKAQRGRRDDFD
jgi:putative DNA primase/helicase